MKPAMHAIACRASTSRLWREHVQHVRAVADRERRRKADQLAVAGSSERDHPHRAQQARGGDRRAGDPAPHDRAAACAATARASRACGARRARTHMPTRPSPHASARRACVYLKRRQRHQPHRLGAIRQDILLLPSCAVAEDDRHLDDAEAGPHGAVGELDLEGVALRAHAVEVDRFEHLAAKALEAAGQVAHVQAEHPARVRRAALADQAPQRGPSRSRRRPGRSASRARGRRRH